MPAQLPDSGSRPIRVVLFGGGPTLESGVRHFIVRLSEHPDIDFLGGFLQPGQQPIVQIVGDLWRRRRFLAGPLLFALLFDAIARYAAGFRTQIRLNRSMAKAAPRLYSVPNIHAEEVLAKVRQLEPDLGLIYGSPILKPGLFSIPRLGSLGIHHGKVPQYRGKKTTFWSIYNGETTSGVTIQRVNAKLDAGEIVKEGEVTIGRRSRRSIWQDLETLGVELYVKAILDVKNGTVQYRPQKGPRGKLYRDPGVNDLLVFWWRQVKRRLRIS